MKSKTVIAIYIRVSTQEQASEGYSIGEQEARLTKYADAHNWIVFKVYSDPGYSGAKMDRPGLKDLIQDVKAGKIKKVLVYKLDRLSRSQKDTLYLIEDVFIPNEVDFVSMTENLDTGTPFGRAMIGILSVFAQLEREQIRERMQLGADARAKDGYYHGGAYAPIGYDYVEGELIINEYEALQIRKIYELAETGIPIYSVFKYMRDHGYKHKYGSWTDSSIRSALTSIVYSGRITWKGKTYPGRHEAIIDLDRYERMIKYLDNRDTGKFKKHAFQRTTLLGGIIFCGNCGARYYCKQNTVKRHKGTPEDAKPNRYYTCYSRGKSSKRLIKDPNCRNKNYNVKDLDSIILGEIEKLALDNSYFMNIIEENKPEDHSGDHKIIEDRIKEIDKQIGKLVELYQVSGIDFNMINEKIQALNEEKNSLTYNLDNEDTVTPDLPIQEAKQLLNTFPEILAKADPDELRDIVHSLIDGIIINGEDLEIHWKFI